MPEDKYDLETWWDETHDWEAYAVLEGIGYRLEIKEISLYISRRQISCRTPCAVGCVMERIKKAVLQSAEPDIG